MPLFRVLLVETQPFDVEADRLEPFIKEGDGLVLLRNDSSTTVAAFPAKSVRGVIQLDCIKDGR